MATRSRPTPDLRPDGAGPVRAIVVHPTLKRAREESRTPEERLREAVGLAGAIALQVVHAEVARLARHVPATLIGSGVVERLKGFIAEAEVALAVIDADLAPIQQRNLEKAWGCKVIDRTGLILEIFGARARTGEGRLQVELARLLYQRSRLVRTWTHLERQRGGGAFLAGPGESQLEIDKRLIGDRIIRLKRELDEVRRTRGLQRRARERVPFHVVALVGYTNAGKSTLFNRATKSDVVAADMLFATLDPTMRALELPAGRKVILSDTVGFISNLPHDLVAAFRATLEEVKGADLVIHVRDIAHGESAAQAEDVAKVLAELGLDADVPVIEALNKIDLLDPAAREIVVNQAARDPDRVPISAVTGEGLAALWARVEARLSARDEVVEVTLAHRDGAALAWLYRHGEVLERQDGEQGARVRVRLAPEDRARFERRSF